MAHASCSCMWCSPISNVCATIWSNISSFFFPHHLFSSVFGCAVFTPNLHTHIDKQIWFFFLCSFSLPFRIVGWRSLEQKIYSQYTISSILCVNDSITYEYPRKKKTLYQRIRDIYPNARVETSKTNLWKIAQNEEKRENQREIVAKIAHLLLINVPFPNNNVLGDKKREKKEEKKTTHRFNNNIHEKTAQWDTSAEQ